MTLGLLEGSLSREQSGPDHCDVKQNEVKQNDVKQNDVKLVRQI